MKSIVLSFHLLVFFCFFGVILTALGIISGLFSLWGKVYAGLYQSSTDGCLSFLIFLRGMMFPLFAMLYDMEQERSMNGWY